MPTLSVVMIVKDEAACLVDCLESVRGIAQEIIVADTGSTDGTEELARRHGAQVFSIPWESDFAAARNHTLDAASGDWLLHMDADELLDPDGAQRIRQLVDQDGEGADAIELILANYCDDVRAWRWTPVSPGNAFARGRTGYIAVGLLRLFRNRRGFRYREPIHENITQSVLENGGRIRQESILIHHYGYDPGKARAGEKARRYLDIAREKMAKYPHDIKALHDFAEQALACNLTAEAEEACRHALEMAPLDLDCATTLANILLNRGNVAEAEVLLNQLESAGIAPPHVVTALAAIACRDGRLAEALQRLDAVLCAAPGTIMAWLYRARVWDRLARPDRAQADLDAIGERAPGLQEFQCRAEAHRMRIRAEHLFTHGQTTEALPLLVNALRFDPEDPYIHNGLAVVLYALGETQRAREALQRALQLAPNLPEALDNLRLIGQ